MGRTKSDSSTWMIFRPTRDDRVPGRGHTKEIKMSKYRKLIVAVLGAVIVAAQTFWGVDLAAKGLSVDMIMGLAVPVLTAFGVWAVPNKEA